MGVRSLGGDGFSKTNVSFLGWSLSGAAEGRGALTEGRPVLAESSRARKFRTRFVIGDRRAIAEHVGPSADD